MSTDSSEEENLDHFREAVDFQFVNDCKSTVSNLESNKTVKLVSLRRTDDNDKELNPFHLTPEFQNYIAKQLTRTLDRTLEFQSFSIDFITQKRSSEKSRVKLFSDSKKYLKIGKDNSDLTITQIKTLKSKLPKKYQYTEIDKELLKQVVVNPNELLNQTNIKYWFNRKKSPVFRYKKLANGDLEQIQEPQI